MQRKQTAEDLFSYEKEFLAAEQADHLFDWCEQQELRKYPFRGKLLKRSPKLEWGTDESVGTYRWGQQKESHDWVGCPFPEPLEQVRQQLGDPDINHVILIGYKDGRENHIPWHSDKQEGVECGGAHDIVGGTNIYNVVVCDSPRRFHLAFKEDIPESKTGHAEAEQYVFDEPLEHGSMIKLTADGNRFMKHRVPKEKGWKGHRYSMVFRKIKSKSEQQ